MEAGMQGASWFSEQHNWDHLFDNPPHVEQLDVDLDAVDWSSWGNLIVDDINASSLNNLSLQALEEYLMDAELQDDNNNMEEALISNPRKDGNVFRCPIDSTDPVNLQHPTLIAGDQLVSDYAVTNNSSSKSKSIVTDNASSSSLVVDNGSVEYKGSRLLHLLTICAEAMSEGAQDLVEIILCRLRQLVSCTGSTMERVGYYLFDALLHSNVNSLPHLELNDKTSKEHFLGALKLLHVAYPYIRIPYFTANECILEAVAAAGGGNNVGIHIIDFDIMEGMQWPSLMEALRNKDDVRRLKITAIKWADEEEDEFLHYSGHTGRRLSEYASSAGIPFSYQETDLNGLNDILPSQEGEIVVVNCMWQLPHMLNLRNKSHLFEFLVGSRHLNPAVVTLITGAHGTESDSPNFVESFARRLKELSAIFDSLEGGLPEHGLARAMVERIFFGPAMSKRVMNSARGDHIPADTTHPNVLDMPLRCGYEECSVSNNNMIYAKYNVLMCSGSGERYEVELVGEHRLVLKWGCTPLVWFSSWKSPSSSCGYPVHVSNGNMFGI